MTEFIKKNKDILFIFLISLIPLFSLLNAGLPVTHDGQDHVARIANFYTSLAEGNIIPRWAGNLNWGYGHPILMFLYPLPSYVASLFHFVGFGLVDSVKLVFGLAYILSGLSMYLWGRVAFGKIPGFVMAILYLYAPYRFIDMYVRGAIGEHVAFVFPPLILYFLYKSFKSKSYYLYLIGVAFSMAGLILSHNAISLIFLPFIVFYIIYLYIKQKQIKILVLSVASIVYGFLLSAFFWVPAFLEGKYTLRDIVTGNEALSRFVDFRHLFISEWNFGGTNVFSVEIGLVHWLFVLLTPIGIYFLKKNKKDILFYTAVLVYFLGSIYIMLPASEFIWLTITTLQKFQFPWRFLTVSVFAAAILGGLFVSSLENKKAKIITLVLALCFLLFLSRGQWYPKDYQSKDESFYEGIYESTTDTGESAPIWSVRFMESFPDSNMEVIEGNAEIREISRNSTHHSYEIISDNSSRVKENTLYFPGWKIYIDGKEYKGIEFQDPEHRGLMTFKILDGEHRVEVIFEETRLRMISNIISLVSFIIVISFLFYSLRLGKKNNK